MNKQWWKTAGIKALKTMAEMAIPLIPANLVLWDINWLQIIGVVLVSGVTTILFALKGLPEMES